jgi:hypothetical protein
MKKCLRRNNNNSSISIALQRICRHKPRKNTTTHTTTHTTTSLLEHTVDVVTVSRLQRQQHTRRRKKRTITSTLKK